MDEKGIKAGSSLLQISALESQNDLTLHLSPITYQHRIKGICIISEEGKHGPQIRVSQLGAKINTGFSPKALSLLSIPCKNP